MLEPWYPMDSLPPVRAVVRVWWYAFGTPQCFEVARTWRQSKRAFEWLRYDPETQEVHPIPPKGRDKSNWAPEPTCWQPVDATVWRWPGDVPEPLLPHQIPRMAGTDYLSREVDAAELEEAGREAERDRHDAQRGDRHAEPSDLIRSRWWADITNIRYEPKGEITRRMAEGRVLRALAWCGAGRGLTVKTSTVGALLARMAEVASGEAAIAEAERSARLHGLPMFQPLPQDHDDFPIAMAWFAALSPPEIWSARRKAWDFSRVQKVVHRRTLTIPLSWADIGASFGNPERSGSGISSTRVRQLYASGIDSCWRVANGGEAIPGKRITDQIVALQERNREHRRRA